MSSAPRPRAAQNATDTGDTAGSLVWIAGSRMMPSLRIGSVGSWMLARVTSLMWIGSASPSLRRDFFGSPGSAPWKSRSWYMTGTSSAVRPQSISSVVTRLSRPTSYDGVPHFLCDRQTEPASFLLGAGATLRDRQDMATVQLGSTALHREKLGALSQPHLLGDARRPAARHGEPRYFFAIVTEMRLRPLERRRRRTSRPPRVFLRARNPWVRLRLLLCG